MESSGFPPVAGADRPSRRYSAFLLVLAVVLFVALVAGGVVLLTGTVRLGSPGASGARFATRVDGKANPVAPRNIFSGTEARIYCCLQVHAFPDTVLEARWSTGGREVGGYRVRYGRLAGGSPVAFLPAAAAVALYQDMPRGGWPEGRYDVKVYLSGRLAALGGFTLSAAAARQSGADTATYRDPGGSFTVGYPVDWVAADPASLAGTLVGRLAPQGAYPQRFAVVATDFTSASADYLNGVLAAAGIPESQRFTAFQLNGREAARRTFDSLLKQGNGVVALRSIQVVVQGTGVVLSLDCHCLAAEFDANRDTFESIIGSMRVR